MWKNKIYILILLIFIISCATKPDEQTPESRRYVPPDTPMVPFRKNINGDCVDKTLFTANVVMHSEGWDVRIIQGPSNIMKGESHIQTQAYISGGAQPAGWYWLVMYKGYVKIGVQDNFTPTEIITVNEVREWRQP